MESSDNSNKLRQNHTAMLEDFLELCRDLEPEP
jgi:hypothetical protein